MYVFWKKHDFFLHHSGQGRSFKKVELFSFIKWKLTLLPRGEGAHQGGWGVWECRGVNPSPTVWDGPPSPNRRGVSSMVLDSATSPFGFAQNDKGEFFLTIVKYIKRGWRWWWIYYYIDLYLTAKTCTQGQWGISDRGDFWSQRKLFIYKTIYLMTEANFQQ